jgi:5-methylcytosine-specific restriction protein A
MPLGVPRSCTFPSCTVRIPKGEFCPIHSPRWAWRDPALNASSARGYGAAWRILRGEVLARDQGWCQPCRRAGAYVRASQVDHVRAKINGGTDHLANLESVCDHCHYRKSAQDRRRG